MKRAPKCERLDWEELESAPNTRGAFSFLNTQPAVIDIRQYLRTEPAIENLSTAPEVISAADTSQENSSAQVKADREPRRRPYIRHLCRTVQDAHSSGETQLLTSLWRNGTLDDTGNKTITIGLNGMARLASMSDKAAKRNISGLIEKLAVEVVRAEVSATRTGRTYRIFPYDVILQKRRAAGMLYVERDKGVRFVAAVTYMEAAPAVEKHITSTVDVMKMGDKTSPYAGDKTSTVWGDKTSTDTGDKTSPPLNSLLRKRNKQTTTEDLDVVVNALLTFTGTTDDSAARRIVLECRTRCEDATAEEIARIVAVKAPDIMRDRNVIRPIGLLISAIPKCFEATSISHFRRQWTVEKEAIEKRKKEEAEENIRREKWLREERGRCIALLHDDAATDLQRRRSQAQIVQINALLKEES